MDITRFLDNPISAWIFAESFLNDGSPSGYGPGPDVESSFLPTSGHLFGLHVLLSDRDEALTRCGDGRVNVDKDDAHNYLCIHPQHYRRLKQHQRAREFRETQVFARATSSVRTVWVFDEGSPYLFVKLHFPARIGRFAREVRLHSWLSSLENSRLVASGLSEKSLTVPRGFAYLPEAGGSYLETDGMIEGFGHIERLIKPLPYRNNNCLILPYFSLWATESIRSSAGTVLRQVIDVFAFDYVSCLEHFVRPLIEGYKFLALDVGLIPECNAQNVLWEFDQESRTSRAVHRDLMGMFKDREFGMVKHADKYPLNTYHTIGDNRGTDTQERRSFAFDFKLSEYILDPLTQELASVFQKPLQKCREEARTYVSEIIQWPEGYFPRTGIAYGYPRESRVGRDRYVQLGYPKYR